MTYASRPSSEVTIQDNDSIAFNSGNSYRVNYPFSIPQGGSPIVLKYVVSEPTILTLSTIEVDQGGVLYRIFTVPQTTELTDFTNPILVYPKNFTVIPKPSPVEVFDDGSASFSGQENTTLRIRTASGGGNRNSAVLGDSTKRGFGVTTVYAEISILEGVNTETIGVLKQEFYRK